MHKMLCVFMYCIGIIAAITAFCFAIYYLYTGLIYKSLIMFIWTVIFILNTITAKLNFKTFKRYEDNLK